MYTLVMTGPGPGCDFGFKVCYHACTQNSVKSLLFSEKMSGTLCTQNGGGVLNLGKYTQNR